MTESFRHCILPHAHKEKPSLLWHLQFLPYYFKSEKVEIVRDSKSEYHNIMLSSSWALSSASSSPKLDLFQLPLQLRLRTSSGLQFLKPMYPESEFLVKSNAHL